MKCNSTLYARNVSAEARKFLRGGLILIALFLSVLSVGSCSRYCAKHYPPVIQIIDSSRVKTEIKYRDTTIFIHIPGKTIYDSIPIQVQIPGLPPSIVPNRVHLELEYCAADSWIANSKLFLNLSQKDTILATKLKNAIKDVLTTSEHWKQETVRLTAEVKQAKQEGINQGKTTGRYQGVILMLVIIGLILAVKKYLL